MIRPLILVLAAGLVAAPACAETIRIPIAGKSAEQVQAEVTRAAQRIYDTTTEGATFRRREHDACVAQTLANVVVRRVAPTQFAKR